MHTDLHAQKEGINVGQKERVISGAAGAALICFGLQRRSLGGLLLAGAGLAAIKRGLTGHCDMYKMMGVSTASQKKNKAEDEKIEEAISIRRPREEVFKFWRKIENLPRIMSHLEMVESLGGNKSHWIARGPMDAELSWDAEVINEAENEMIAWRSLPGSELSNAGSVWFEDGGDGMTHLRLSLAFTPPGGKIGATIAEYFGGDPREQIRSDLKRFKTFMESRADIPVLKEESAGNPAAMNA
jgi:uncharacterized membrane protein